MALNHIGAIASGVDTTSSETVVIPVTIAVPAGALVCVGATIAMISTITTCNVTDSKGNTYTADVGAQTATAVQDLFIRSSVITTPLTTSDSITVTWPGTARTRKAAAAHAFDGVVWDTPPNDMTASANGSTSTLSVGPTDPLSSVPQLAFAAFSNNASTTLTPGGTGWTDGVEIHTTVGSSDRGLATIWKDITAVGTVTAIGGYSASGTRVGVLATYAYTGPTQLDVPDSFVFSRAVGLRQIDASWDAVSDAVGYALEVDVLADGGNVEDPDDWAAVDEFTPAETELSIDNSDGIDWGKTYRGRVRAVAPE